MKYQAKGYCIESAPTSLKKRGLIENLPPQSYIPKDVPEYCSVPNIRAEKLACDQTFLFYTCTFIWHYTAMSIRDGILTKINTIEMRGILNRDEIP